MTHAVILPVALPLLAAIACLAARGLGPRAVRMVSLGAAAALLPLALHLLSLADDGEVRIYRLGDWPPPFGIVLVLDRLSALMVAVVCALALPTLVHVGRGLESAGRHFHPLFQLQLAGLCGAFLTGDLFNLFVFFEVLLLASYALLLHGGGLARARAGLAYVVLNLAGSAVFLIALGLLYGLLGTLNLADMARLLPAAASENQALLRATAALLVVVFALKAALLPLSFWLPHAYAAAHPAVAALFVVMTKVGVYALLRLWAIGLAGAPFTEDLLRPWLTPLALATIAAGTLGAVAAAHLRGLIANLVLISTGTLLVAVADGQAEASAAALYYAVHTTFVTAAFFLLAERIAAGRGGASDRLSRGPALAGLGPIGAVYLLLAVSVSGVPPLSGFIGKLMLMRAVEDSAMGMAVWATLLISGLLVALALARAASALFWEPAGAAHAPAERPAPGPLSGKLALGALAAASALLVIGAPQLADYARAAAEQLHAREPYISAVLDATPAFTRGVRP